MCSASRWIIFCSLICVVELRLLKREKLPKLFELSKSAHNFSDEDLDRWAKVKHSKDCKKYDKQVHRDKRQNPVVGTSCNENIDCLTVNFGYYCDPTKRCDCLPSYINIGGFCWKKFNPDETGCIYQEQCSSVWPGATCSSSNVCKCPNNQPAVQLTDGAVCISTGGCPTNSFNSKLKDEIGVDAVCGGPDPLCLGLEYDCYNCLPVDPVADPLTCTGSSYCCPTRALACIMPREDGNSGGGSVRTKYYYNPATDTCEVMSYQGAGGNANNFDTKAQCDSYCRTACPRGRPQYVGTSGPVDRTTIVTCTAATSAVTCTNPTFLCNSNPVNSASNSYCCLTPKTICETGGLVPNLPPQPNPNIGLPGPPTMQTRQRYYYDVVTRTCLPFTYLGQGGNFNNFATESYCQQYCAQAICPQGDPLRDTSRNIISCSAGSTTACPSKYDCTNGNCCPSANFICSLPQAIGTCMTYSQRWWFNPDSRTCVEFTYGGCQGNFNNFPTYLACQNYCGTTAAAPKCPQGSGAIDSSTNTFYVCSASASSSTVSICPLGYYCYYDGFRYGCCPTKVQTCETEASTLTPGTACITPVSRWWYNLNNRKCEQFTYNGCDGNSNNFATELDCKDYCGVGGCKEGGGEPFKEAGGQYRVCSLTGSECPFGYSCTEVVTATSNTNLYCCASKDFVCRLTQDQGAACGIGSLTRYSFNPVTRTCVSFTYRGCGGNRNNFATERQCQNYCNSAACAAGQVALRDIAALTLISCQTSGTISSGCPNGYTCITNTLLGANICCGSDAPAGTCPAGQFAYMDSFTSTPLQCIQNTDGQCPMTPNRYQCQPSLIQSGANFCCASTVVVCSRGGRVGTDTSNNPRQCTPNISDNCPSGYECQPTSFLVATLPSATGYCCGTPNPCGQGFNTLFTNNQPVTCDPTSVANSCSNPTYTCTRTANGQSYCCISAALAVNPCGIGRSPYLIQNAPTVCIPGSGNTGAGCPVGYSCDLYAAINTNYCCIGGVPPPPSGQGSCPAGVALATTCTVTSNCGIGYVCKPGTSSATCCPAPATACGLPQEVGQACTTASPGQRFAFNPTTRSCTSFSYLGCGANSNNFFTVQACEEFCMSALCGRGKPQYVSGGPVQTCTTTSQCNAGFDCRPSLFGAAGSICCQSSTTVCSLPSDGGRSCSAFTVIPMQMFYFNSATRTCQQYGFSGCGGNWNSFETQAECQTFCSASIVVGNPCPSSRTVQVNPATNQPQLCISAGCASGFVCTYSSTASNYYCCSRVAGVFLGGINGCSSGTPFLFPGTNSPLGCSTTSGSRCPNGFSCVRSTNFVGFQCCSSSAQTATVPAISCKSGDDCRSRLKSAKAYCNLSSFLCSCDPQETFKNNTCSK